MSEDLAVDQAALELEWLIADALAEKANTQHEDDNGWLPDWFMGKVNGYKADVAMIKEQARKKIAQKESMIAALWWNWGREFQTQVNKDVAAQEGNRKSIHYLNGSAGNRTVSAKQRVVVINATQASLLLEKVCPAAVDYSIRKKEYLEYFQQTGEAIAGIEVEQTEARESFFPKRPDRYEEQGDEG